MGNQVSSLGLQGAAWYLDSEGQAWDHCHRSGVCVHMSRPMPGFMEVNLESVSVDTGLDSGSIGATWYKGPLK